MHPASDLRQPLAPDWFADPAGQAVLASALPAVQAALGAHPCGTWLWLHPGAALEDESGLPGHGLRLRLSGRGMHMSGDLRCGLPLPLASQSLGCVVVQHAGDAAGGARDALLEECARVLLPDGVLAVVSLNPASPYRLRWQGRGVGGAEPVTWRRRLRRAGLAPEAVALGLGPRWQVGIDQQAQDGAGMRAAYLLRARKRIAALTPLRPARIGAPAVVPGA